MTSEIQQLQEQAKLSGECLAKALNQSFSDGMKTASLALPPELKGSLYQSDLLNYPKLSLASHQVLNFNPASYFGMPVSWPAPAIANIPSFMEVIGLGFLAPLTDRIRFLINGQVYVHSVSGLWFLLFGLEVALPKGRLRKINQIRPKLEQEPQMMKFLEALQ